MPCFPIQDQLISFSIIKGVKWISTDSWIWFQHKEYVAQEHGSHTSQVMSSCSIDHIVSWGTLFKITSLLKQVWIAFTFLKPDNF